MPTELPPATTKPAKPTGDVLKQKGAAAAQPTPAAPEANAAPETPANPPKAPLPAAATEKQLVTPEVFNRLLVRNIELLYRYFAKQEYAGQTGRGHIVMLEDTFRYFLAAAQSAADGKEWVAPLDR